jgi:hypothetical protein
MRSDGRELAGHDGLAAKRLIIVGSLAVLAGLVLALVLPFHDGCGSLATVCTPTKCLVACHGWGFQPRALIALGGLLIGLVAWLSAAWLNHRRPIAH